LENIYIKSIKTIIEDIFIQKLLNIDPLFLTFQFARCILRRGVSPCTIKISGYYLLIYKSWLTICYGIFGK